MSAFISQQCMNEANPAHQPASKAPMRADRQALGIVPAAARLGVQPQVEAIVAAVLGYPVEPDQPFMEVRYPAGY